MQDGLVIRFGESCDMPQAKWGMGNPKVEVGPKCIRMLLRVARRKPAVD